MYFIYLLISLMFFLVAYYYGCLLGELFRAAAPIQTTSWYSKARRTDYVLLLASIMHIQVLFFKNFIVHTYWHKLKKFNRLPPPPFSQADRRQNKTVKKAAYVLCKSVFFTLGYFPFHLSSYGIPMLTVLLDKGAVPAWQKVKHTAIV